MICSVAREALEGHSSWEIQLGAQRFPAKIETTENAVNFITTVDLTVPWNGPIVLLRDGDIVWVPSAEAHIPTGEGLVVLPFGFILASV